MNGIEREDWLRRRARVVLGGCALVAGIYLSAIALAIVLGFQGHLDSPGEAWSSFVDRFGAVGVAALLPFSVLLFAALVVLAMVAGVGGRSRRWGRVTSGGAMVGRARDLALAVGRSDISVRVVPAAAPNGCLVGSARHPQIVLTTAAASLPPRELDGLIAHLLAQAVRPALITVRFAHQAVIWTIRLAQSVWVLAAATFVLGVVTGHGEGAGVVVAVAGLLWLFAALVLAPLVVLDARVVGHGDALADRDALAITNDPDGLADVCLRLVEDKTQVSEDYPGAYWFERDVSGNHIATLVSRIGTEHSMTSRAAAAMDAAAGGRPRARERLHRLVKIEALRHERDRHPMTRVRLTVGYWASAASSVLLLLSLASYPDLWLAVPALGLAVIAGGCWWRRSVFDGRDTPRLERVMSDLQHLTHRCGMCDGSGLVGWGSPASRMQTNPLVRHEYCPRCDGHWRRPRRRVSDRDLARAAG